MILDTPIGPLGVLVRDARVTEVHFDPDGRFAGARDAEVAKRLAAYFDGDLAALDAIETAGEGSAFRRRVWKAMRAIAPGSTMSYGELAERAGVPGAARAVGTACAQNPVGIIVPCHRVVRSDGSMGGYAGGLDRKRWLLQHERARVARA